MSFRELKANDVDSTRLFDGMSSKTDQPFDGRFWSSRPRSAHARPPILTPAVIATTPLRAVAIRSSGFSNPCSIVTAVYDRNAYVPEKRKALDA
jgi:hypothetical protein